MNRERLMNVLVGPHLSEKSTNVMGESNQVVFKVLPNATKSEIKQAVELLFEVDVKNVTTTRVKGKVKRFGLSFGRRSDWKKAYIRLAEGQTIEEFDFAAGLE
ncbi:MAG: 50S ribosomal protein L23 [Gammaproteobacteria bacterium]|nr:50S ribosomal protein L23 [Gammaproteobacteria bacterium]